MPTLKAVDSPELVAALTGHRIAVLTGAGISTDSGIPDYRGPDSPPSNPMTIRQFTSDPVFRQRYWARNHVGWRHMDDTAPNAGHRALAALERAGVVTGVITQNVDLLHTKAGSKNVVNLHGTYAQVTCLGCGHTISRSTLAAELESLNPGFIERAEAVGGLAVAPDADAVIADTESFRYIDCRCCGDAQARYRLLRRERPQRTCGSSIFTGRSVRRAACGRFVTDRVLGLSVSTSRRGTGIPVAIINRGHTRGDDLADVKVDGGCSELLVLLASELAAAVYVEPITVC